MRLHIDTTSREKITITIDNEIFENIAVNNKSQQLIPFIEEKLSDKNISFSDLSEISVNIGPGSFTGIRIGVSVAQTLAWSLQIPLNGNDISQKKYLNIQY